MANEALLRVRTEPPINFACTNTPGFEKGALMTFSDPMLASGAVTVSCIIAGILASEKISGDGKFFLPIYRRGIFDMVASGAITAGNSVMSSSDANYPNTVMQAKVTGSGAAIIGHALETASDAERILIWVDVGCGGAQIS